MPREIPCPIWGEGNKATIQGEEINITAKTRVLTRDSLIGSPRAGGAYRLDEYAGSVFQELQSLTIGAKARLTTWLVDQRRHGIRVPVITWEIANSFRLTGDGDSLPVPKRGERLLLFLLDRTKSAGHRIVVSNRYLEALAWSESTELSEIFFLLNYLSSRGFIEDYEHFTMMEAPCLATVTVEGYGFIEEVTANRDSTQAFVAMWFAEEMDDAYNQGIKPAIEEAGYKPLRIDLKPDVKKIDDEIFAEVRRSRFLVADMTQGDDGARGGVYFEAGFAEGLGLPVLYTCHKDRMKHLAFDTRQFFHVEWDTPVELRKELATRIRSRVGEGPLREASDQD